MTNPQPKPSAQDTLIGHTVLGRFEVVRPLARGGMGVLYLARTRGAQGFVRPVVVKRLSLDATDEMVRMFVREAQVMAALNHPNIVQAIDFNREGDDYLLVMEYIEGYSLGRWAKFVRDQGRAFSVSAAVQVVIDVLEALAYAHELSGVDGSAHGIIHRDVTPTNVMISVDGHVKLLDFGIARMQHDKTAEGPEGPTIKGKFAFLAPELLAGGEPSASSDVYAAALVLHELLLGKNEFAADDLSATLVAVTRKVPTRLDVARKNDVPKALADIVVRALLKDPLKRYATARELADALRAAREGDGQSARVAMASQIREDFLHPAMVEALHGADLQTLAKAWQADRLPSVDGASGEVSIEAQRTRTETLAKPLDGNTAVAPVGYDGVVARTRESVPTLKPPKRIVAPAPSAATDADEPRVDALTAPQRPVVDDRAHNSKSGPLVLAAWAAAVAALAALGAAVLVLYRTQPSAGQGFVVIEGQNNATISDAAVATPTVTDASASGASTVVEAPDAAESNVVVPRPRRTVEPADEAARLTQHFARYRGQVEACARRHATEAASSPIEGIRFAVDRSGSVRGAVLQPESASASALGTCVLDVARRARFPASDQGVTFRVPLSVRIAPR